jgi:hypothetical protein
MVLLSAFMVSLLTGLACFQAADATVFKIDSGIFDNLLTITGSVTTNGELGTLAASDIDSWNLTVISSPLTTILTPLNSTLGVVGSALSATATELTFDFSSGAGTVQIEGPTGFWCLAGTISVECTLASGSGAVAQNSEALGVASVDQSHFAVGNMVLSGAQVIGVAAVPEPSVWAMLVLGFAGLGFIGYRKTKSSPMVLPAA